MERFKSLHKYNSWMLNQRRDNQPNRNVQIIGRSQQREQLGQSKRKSSPKSYTDSYIASPPTAPATVGTGRLNKDALKMNTNSVTRKHRSPFTSHIGIVTCREVPSNLSHQEKYMQRYIQWKAARRQETALLLSKCTAKTSTASSSARKCPLQTQKNPATSSVLGTHTRNKSRLSIYTTVPSANRKNNVAGAQRKFPVGYQLPKNPVNYRPFKSYQSNFKLTNAKPTVANKLPAKATTTDTGKRIMPIFNVKLTQSHFRNKLRSPARGAVGKLAKPATLKVPLIAGPNTKSLGTLVVASSAKIKQRPLYTNAPRPHNSARDSSTTRGRTVGNGGAVGKTKLLKRANSRFTAQQAMPPKIRNLSVPMKPREKSNIQLKSQMICNMPELLMVKTAAIELESSSSEEFVSSTKLKAYTDKVQSLSNRELVKVCRSSNSVKESIKPLALPTTAERLTPAELPTQTNQPPVEQPTTTLDDDKTTEPKKNKTKFKFMRYFMGGNTSKPLNGELPWTEDTQKVASEMETVAKTVSMQEQHNQQAQKKIYANMPAKVYAVSGQLSLPLQKTRTEELHQYRRRDEVSPHKELEQFNSKQVAPLPKQDIAAIKTPPRPVMQPPTERWCTPETAHNFRRQLNNETRRLHALCDKWQMYKVDHLLLLRPVAGDDMINTAIGRTKVLINQKFKQFSRLIDRCMGGAAATDNNNENTKPITVADLEEFWSMVSLHVDDVDKLFANLERWKANNWTNPDIVTPQKRPKRNSTELSKVKAMNAAGSRANMKVKRPLLQQLRKMPQTVSAAARNKVVADKQADQAKTSSAPTSPDITPTSLSLLFSIPPTAAPLVPMGTLKRRVSELAARKEFYDSAQKVTPTSSSRTSDDMSHSTAVRVVSQNPKRRASELAVLKELCDSSQQVTPTSSSRTSNFTVAPIVTMPAFNHHFSELAVRKDFYDSQVVPYVPVCKRTQNSVEHNKLLKKKALLASSNHKNKKANATPPAATTAVKCQANKCADGKKAPNATSIPAPPAAAAVVKSQIRSNSHSTLPNCKSILKTPGTFKSNTKSVIFLENVAKIKNRSRRSP